MRLPWIKHFDHCLTSHFENIVIRAKICVHTCWEKEVLSYCLHFIQKKNTDLCRLKKFNTDCTVVSTIPKRLLVLVNGFSLLSFICHFVTALSIQLASFFFCSQTAFQCTHSYSLHKAVIAIHSQVRYFIMNAWDGLWPRRGWLFVCVYDGFTSCIVVIMNGYNCLCVAWRGLYDWCRKCHILVWFLVSEPAVS